MAFNQKHLWWIIPLTMIVGFVLGYIIGVNDTVYMLRKAVNMDQLCTLFGYSNG